MPRTQRLKINDETAVYHVMSRAALDGFPLGAVEKDLMLDLIRRYAALYVVEILGFCLMGNHFHILVRMVLEYQFSDEDIKARYELFYGEDGLFAAGLIPSLREKLSNQPGRPISVPYPIFYRFGDHWHQRICFRKLSQIQKSIYDKKG